MTLGRVNVGQFNFDGQDFLFVERADGTVTRAYPAPQGLAAALADAEVPIPSSPMTDIVVFEYVCGSETAPDDYAVVKRTTSTAGWRVFTIVSVPDGYRCGVPVGVKHASEREAVGRAWAESGQVRAATSRAAPRRPGER